MVSSFKELADELWRAADSLRANTPLRSSEYSVPVLGLIFLKFADQKFTLVEQQLQERSRQASGRQFSSPGHYKAEGAIYLNNAARYSYLRTLGTGLPAALNNAMTLIAQDNEELQGALPTQAYSALDNNTLKPLLATFDGIPLDYEGDLFGRIYEYFLGKFALAEGQRGGEFFTPTSIVKLIVEIIEPYHGMILDPACGSGGMFVQSAQFVQRHRRGPGEEVSIYGQEKALETVRLCKMNLAVHGLTGDVRGANSYYEDPFDSSGKFDFVMANPPFNVNGVEKDRLLNPKQRFPFDPLRVDNGNYLWIQLFYSALKGTGRAGFVMPNSASDVRASEQEIRRKIIQQRVVDVMVSVSSNFFFTVTLPCTLWFFDKAKRATERANNVLFIDARHLYKQIDRAHREFTPQQIEFLTNIVRLYRGEIIENEQGSAAMMQEHFPAGRYADVTGLCKVATLAEIEAQGWSLNPGRYVQVSESVTGPAITMPFIGEWNRETDRYARAKDTVTAPTIKRTSVFISYCHKDKKHLERLNTHLASLKSEQNIDIWDDTRISAGEEWRKQIKKALRCAKVAILLISADFLASKFIAEDEIPPLLEAAKKEKAVILPVILSACAFTDSQLAEFQSVNDPSRPLISMDRNHKEKIWDKVARRVREIMNSKS